MKTQFTDYNGAEKVLGSLYKNEWEQISQILSEMPLHIKKSDQAGKIGNFIFNPVGTNKYIEKKLKDLSWASKISIPGKYSFLGLDVDFAKKGVIVEVQFSNYPFLLNNLVRSELFYKSKILLTKEPVDTLIIVTKACMFPASNSTLYYEQAVNQINELSKNKVFDIPIRLVGLFEETDKDIKALLTTYDKERYSRTIVSELDVACNIKQLNSSKTRCVITRLE